MIVLMTQVRAVEAVGSVSSIYSRGETEKQEERASVF